LISNELFFGLLGLLVLIAFLICYYAGRLQTSHGSRRRRNRRVNRSSEQYTDEFTPSAPNEESFEQEYTFSYGRGKSKEKFNPEIEM
jgi:hypothetical protein